MRYNLRSHGYEIACGIFLIMAELKPLQIVRKQLDSNKCSSRKLLLKVLRYTITITVHLDFDGDCKINFAHDPLIDLQ